MCDDDLMFTIVTGDDIIGDGFAQVFNKTGTPVALLETPDAVEGYVQGLKHAGVPEAFIYFQNIEPINADEVAESVQFWNSAVAKMMHNEYLLSKYFVSAEKHNVKVSFPV